MGVPTGNIARKRRRYKAKLHVLTLAIMREGREGCDVGRRLVAALPHIGGLRDSETVAGRVLVIVSSVFPTHKAWLLSAASRWWFLSFSLWGLLDV